MTTIKIEVQVKDLQKGDIFRSVESVGNIKQTFEYAVVSIKTEVRTMAVGDSGTTRDVESCTVKVKNTRNGQGKTKKYVPTNTLTILRTV